MSSAGGKTLEALVTSLQKMAHEMRDAEGIEETKKKQCQEEIQMELDLSK